VNKVLRTLLRTGLYFLEQSDRATADLRDQLRDRVGHITNRTREAMGMESDHAVRDAMSFVAGVGLGLGMGLLFAPASGRETRDLISEKVQEAGSKVRESFSQEMQRAS
jgi:YtxH-like protein